MGVVSIGVLKNFYANRQHTMAQLLKWQPQIYRLLYPLKSPHTWCWDRGGLWGVAGVQQQPVGHTLEPEKTASVEVALGAVCQHPLSKAVEASPSHTNPLKKLSFLKLVDM